MNLANINVIGNITKDPEVKTFQTGTKAMTFSCAVTTDNKDASGNYTSNFYSVTVFGAGLIDALSRQCQKGTQVSVTGPFSARSYAKKDGTTGVDLHINATQVVALARRKDAAEVTPAPAGKTRKAAANYDAPVAPAADEIVDASELPF